MLTFDLGHAALAFLSAFIAGAINSVAGGGTLVSFPVLIWLGLSSVTANATSTVAIWPGSLGGAWGYRRELLSSQPRLFALVVPSLAGGIAGALLLAWTPPGVFDKLAPFLVLFATFLFMAREPLQRRFKTDTAPPSTARWSPAAMLFQFGVALYGGYFGAGIGILMLAALSLLGLTDIYEMNAFKNFLALCINGAAAVFFIWAGMVQWTYVVIMAVGAVAGGYVCAGLAYRVGARTVQRTVVAIGLIMALSLLLKK